MHDIMSSDRVVVWPLNRSQIDEPRDLHDHRDQWQSDWLPLPWPLKIQEFHVLSQLVIPVFNDCNIDILWVGIEGEL